MSNNGKFIITINRELGSGGRTIGEKLAEKLGISFYDKAVIQGLMDKYGLSVDEIERLKAQEKPSWWSNLQQKPSTGQMFETERQILESLAREESCVIAGRSAFLIFREWKNSIHIFIQASAGHRVERLIEKQGMTLAAAVDTIDIVDEGRETYLKKYSNTSRYDTRNYDLVISMDRLSIDDAIQVILDYIHVALKHIV